MSEVVVGVVPSWVATIEVVAVLPLGLARPDDEDEAVGIVGVAGTVRLVVVGAGLVVTGAELLEPVVVAERFEAVFAEGAG
jgi:hypothetical protein